MPRRRREQRSDFCLLSKRAREEKRPCRTVGTQCQDGLCADGSSDANRLFSRVVRQNEVHPGWCGKWTTADFEYDCPRRRAVDAPETSALCREERGSSHTPPIDAHSGRVRGGGRRRPLRPRRDARHRTLARRQQPEDASAGLTATQSAGKRPCGAASAHRPKAGLRLLSCSATPPQSPTAVRRSSCAGAVPRRVTPADVQVIRYERGRTRVWENVATEAEECGRTSSFRPSSHECRRQRPSSAERLSVASALAVQTVWVGTTLCGTRSVQLRRRWADELHKPGSAASPPPLLQSVRCMFCFTFQLTTTVCLVCEMCPLWSLSGATLTAAALRRHREMSGHCTLLPTAVKEDRDVQ